MRHSPLAASLRLAAFSFTLLAATPATSFPQSRVAPSTAATRSAPVVAAVTATRSGSVIGSWTNPDMATLMLVDALPHANARAVVIRRPGDLPNNIILVTGETTAPELAHAVSALLGSRRSKGDRVEREMRAIVAPVSTRAARKPTRDDLRAAADLRRLLRAPIFTIGGIASGPALVIRMAPATAKAQVGTR